MDDKLVLLGDLNARVGNNFNIWTDVIDRHGVGKQNTNLARLLDVCVSHQLVIINNLFRLPDKQETYCIHPRSRHCQLIDYVITRRRDIRDVKVTRVMTSSECWTDHRLIRSKLTLVIKAKVSKVKANPPKMFDVKL